VNENTLTLKIPRRYSTAIRVLVWLLCATAYALTGAAVLADDDVLTVFLGYVPEISTWGNYEARGRAYVDLSRGTVRLEVADLPTHVAVEYHVWLVPAEETDVYLSVGAFTVDPTGSAHVELHKPNLPRLEYRFLVITAEPVPDPDPTPDRRRALGGVFPNIRAITTGTVQAGLLDVLDPGEPVGPSAGSEGGPRVATETPRPPLPVTGREASNTRLYDALVISAAFGLLSLYLATKHVRCRCSREEET